MLGELLGAPAVVDDREAAVRLAPVVDVLPVVGYDVSVAGAVGAHHAAVEELEPVTTTGGSRDDLDLVAVELSVSEHLFHHSRDSES